METRLLVAYALIAVVALIVAGWGLHLLRERRRAKVIARNEWAERRKD